ncbi:hypothetical protein QBC32DRAFT_332988 [Pseudoneurospora amorphoporcata]|uniref:Uncharacterized protein n=1 Tax=Pseudoneurospora amorphoporcata TaxID=241081 RepID=A0AAN6SJX4_9PEZI|nr:hypothetical protein QBC32DRAFT_332988 [Pseudoneurospora amorphoporcata]
MHVLLFPRLPRIPLSVSWVYLVGSFPIAVAEARSLGLGWTWTLGHCLTKALDALYPIAQNKHLHILGPFRNLVGEGFDLPPSSAPPDGKEAGAASWWTGQHRGSYSPSGPGEVSLSPRDPTLCIP